MRKRFRRGWGAALLLAAGPVLGQQPDAGSSVESVVRTYRSVEQPAPAQTPAPPAARPPLPTIELIGEPVPAAVAAVPPAPTVKMPEAALPPGGAGGEAPRSFWQRCRRRLGECFLGVPEEFRDPPLGHAVYAAYKTHVENGEAARMALYRYDFVEGTNALNPRGRHKLAQIAQMLPRNFYPVVIEPGEGPAGLDEARRLAVLNELGQGPFPIPPQRVVTGQPEAIGVSGREAAIIYQNLLMQTQRQGIGAQVGGATAGVGFAPIGGGAGTPAGGTPLGSSSPNP